MAEKSCACVRYVIAAAGFTPVMLDCNVLNDILALILDIAVLSLKPQRMILGFNFIFVGTANNSHDLAVTLVRNRAHRKHIPQKRFIRHSHHIVAPSTAPTAEDCKRQPKLKLLFASAANPSLTGTAQRIPPR